jgi:hypothetical protein
MWKNIVERDRPQMTIWRMRIACRIMKATNTHSEYVILIALPLEQLLHESAPVLRSRTLQQVISVLVPIGHYQRCVSTTFTSVTLGAHKQLSGAKIKD